MKAFTTKIHGILDYSIGFAMIITPSLLHLEEESLIYRLLVVPALLLFLISLLTDHGIGLAKLFSFKNHLKIEFLIGLFLICTPLFFPVIMESFLPHSIFGLLIITSCVFSKKAISSKAENLVAEEIIK